MMAKEIYQKNEYIELEDEAKRLYPESVAQQFSHIKSTTSNSLVITAWILKNVQETSALNTGANIILSAHDIDLIFRALIELFNNMTGSFPAGSFQYIAGKLNEPTEHILKMLKVL